PATTPLHTLSLHDALPIFHPPAKSPPGFPEPHATPTPHIFALGESMGAGIALQSAAANPRIEAVVAEASFANLREAAYDYAGLRSEEHTSELQSPCNLVCR